MENIRVGPSYAFIGDPTQTDVDGHATAMTYLGRTRGDVVINPNAQIAVGRTDQTGSSPLASAIFFSGIAPTVTIPLVDEEKAKMNEVYNNTSIEVSGALEAIGFGSQFREIPLANLNTLCLLPVKDISSYAGLNGVEEPEAFWLPHIVARNYGQFTFNLPEGDDVLNPHEVEFAGLYHHEDQANTPIPESMRVLFQGPPDAGSLGWALPDLSTLTL